MSQITEFLVLLDAFLINCHTLRRKCNFIKNNDIFV